MERFERYRLISSDWNVAVGLSHGTERAGQRGWLLAAMEEFVTIVYNSSDDNVDACLVWQSPAEDQTMKKTVRIDI